MDQTPMSNKPGPGPNFFIGLLVALGIMTGVVLLITVATSYWS